VREKKWPDFYVWLSVFSQKYRKMIIDFYYTKNIAIFGKKICNFYFLGDNIGYQCVF